MSAGLFPDWRASDATPAGEAPALANSLVDTMHGEPLPRASKSVWALAMLVALTLHAGAFALLAMAPWAAPPLDTGAPIIIPIDDVIIEDAAPQNESVLSEAQTAPAQEKQIPAEAWSASAPEPILTESRAEAAQVEKATGDSAPTQMVDVQAPDAATVMPPDEPPPMLAPSRVSQPTEIAMEPRAQPPEPQRVATPAQTEPVAAIAPPPAPLPKPQPSRAAPAVKPKPVEKPRQTAARTGQEIREGAPVARSAAPRADPNALALYKGRVRAIIVAHQRAPAGQQGSAVIAFTIARSGVLAGASLARSSGNAAIDQAALASVRAANPFPPFPEGMPQTSIPFALPFSVR